MLKDSQLEKVITSRVRTAVNNKIESILDARDVKGSKSNELVTVPDAEFTIVEVNEPCSIWGFMDLSGLANGDKVEVSLDMKLNTASEFKLNRVIAFSGPIVDPLVNFPVFETESARVRIKQVSGQQRKIKYHFKWR